MKQSKKLQESSFSQRNLWRYFSIIIHKNIIDSLIQILFIKFRQENPLRFGDGLFVVVRGYRKEMDESFLAMGAIIL